jgi:hypothetical protein
MRTGFQTILRTALLICLSIAAASTEAAPLQGAPVTVLEHDSGPVDEGQARDKWLAAQQRQRQREQLVAGVAAQALGADRRAAVQPMTVTNPVTLIGTPRIFPDSFGDLVSIGEVQNNTSTTLTFTKVQFAFYNSGGGLVGTDYSYTYGSQNTRLALTGSFTNALPPGGRGFFKVWTTPICWNFVVFGLDIC